MNRINFFGIKGDKYITPDSKTILPSITNMSLRTIAEDMGLTVERRHVLVEELGDFEEAGACGTAAVISPIKRIVDRESGQEYNFCENGNAGPISTKLYTTLKGIQEGELEDKFGWNMIVE